MAIFQVDLLSGGKLVKRTVDAPDEASARQRCMVSGETVTVLAVKRRAGIVPWSRQPKFPLGLFLQELSTLLDAGLVLIEAIEALRDKAESEKGLRAVLDELVARMREGQAFSMALAQQPSIFPPLLVATVEASEGSGQLPIALRRFQHYETRLEQIRKRVSGALVYPAVVMAVGAAILLFMLFFVVPRFSAVFESINEPPATAVVMLWWAGLVQQHGMVLLAGLAGLAVATVALVRTQHARRTFLNVLWRTPRLREICHLFVLSRFYRTVGLLLAGGTAAIDALELAGRLLPAPYLPRLERSLGDLRAGQSLSDVLTAQNLTTPVAERLLRVGERSGELGEMCEKIAHFHDGTLDRAIEVFSKLFEPILMLGIGALVGAIVLLLYLPIFELASSIG
ncbi:type II secretion system F family protein [Burkholderia anthina]|uniref:Type II secretion system F family protein n=1 Tax=Burkholderia anthina TaxID=179879 RepID=A0A6P2GF13_9BURK|nr:type II secretion system F family protein [Burkholderia anthina]MBM2771494.1 type II secretion system F family protein [Burkholderia anthina]VVU51564.1 type II secretion system protein [Burkholderia anthina]